MQCESDNMQIKPYACTLGCAQCINEDYCKVCNQYTVQGIMGVFGIDTYYDSCECLFTYDVQLNLLENELTFTVYNTDPVGSS